MNKNFNFSNIILCNSILFSILFLFGYAINTTSTIDILFFDLKHFGIFFLIWILLTVSFYFIISFLYVLLQKTNFNKKKSKIYSFIFDNHPFIIPFILFFIIGLPIIIYFYPGTVQWDGMKQLDYYFNIIPWSNHHPVVPTLLMGTFVKIGKIINDNFGLFLFNFFQFIFSCGVFSYILVYLKKLKAPKGIILLTFIFFLNPIWYINSYTLVKDTLFYLFFALFFIEFINYYQNKNNFFRLLITALLIILFRNNGIYIVLGSLFLLFITKREIKNTLKLILFFLIFQLLYTSSISLLHIKQSNIREMLSVPLQQTARYVNYYELTKEEKEIIENVFHNDILTIQKKYEPELSDPIKFMFDVKNKEQLFSYLKIWIHQFFKHPKIYFDSFLENYYGYFYPLKKEYKDDIACFDIVQNKRVNTGYFNFYLNKFFNKKRNQIIDTIHKFRNTPILELIFNTGFYTWILLFFIFYAFYLKKKDILIISSPIIITLLFCFLSPVNSYIRYMNPIIVSLPILVGYITKKKQ